VYRDAVAAIASARSSFDTVLLILPSCAKRHFPQVLCASGAGCCFSVTMDAPARPFRLGAATGEGLPRKRRLNARVM
jgi:hypothetical protein